MPPSAPDCSSTLQTLRQDARDKAIVLSQQLTQAGIDKEKAMRIAIATVRHCFEIELPPSAAKPDPNRPIR